MIYYNKRVLDNKITGAQRYLLEIESRMDDRFHPLKPSKRLHGALGHAWEQFILPLLAYNKTLWSPSISGPIFKSNQIVTIFDVVPLDHPEWLNKRFALWYRFMLRLIVHNVRKIIVISEFTKKRLVHHFPSIEGKVVVIHLAADARFCPQPRITIDETVNALNLPSNRYVLSVCSLEPRKNLARLLTAWSELVDKIDDDIYLVIVGSVGKSIVFGRTDIPPLPPRVILTGHIDDKYLPALYTGTLVTVYVSLYEGFGLPPLEAMSCGSPVISSNCTSIPEVVGDAGISIDPYSVSEIADSLFSVINNPDLRKSMKEQSLQQSNKFSWELTADKTFSELFNI